MSLAKLHDFNRYFYYFCTHNRTIINLETVWILLYAIKST